MFLQCLQNLPVANVVRKLSKCIDGASHAAYKETSRGDEVCFSHQVVLSKDITS
jgi:hypothetical protein